VAAGGAGAARSPGRREDLHRGGRRPPRLHPGPHAGGGAHDRPRPRRGERHPRAFSALRPGRRALHQPGRRRRLGCRALRDPQPAPYRRGPIAQPGRRRSAGRPRQQARHRPAGRAHAGRGPAHRDRRRPPDGVGPGHGTSGRTADEARVDRPRGRLPPHPSPHAAAARASGAGRRRRHRRGPDLGRAARPPRHQHSGRSLAGRAAPLPQPGRVRRHR
jgi:hypothetical protein